MIVRVQNGELLLDIDLSILGAEEAEFAVGSSATTRFLAKPLDD